MLWKNNKKAAILVWTLLLLHPSCIIFLSNDKKSESSVYNPGKLCQIVYNQEGKIFEKSIDSCIYELTNKDLHQLLQQHTYTWLHIWNPSCPSDRNIAATMCATKYRYKLSDLQTLLVAVSFDADNITKAQKGIDFTCPVYFLSHNEFNKRQGKALRQFAKTIDNNHIIEKNSYFGDYFFRDTLLIKACWKITEEDIQNLLQQ